MFSQLKAPSTVLLVKNKVKKRLEEYDFLAWPQSEKFLNFLNFTTFHFTILWASCS